MIETFIIDKIANWFGKLNGEFVEILPYITTLGIMGCVTIGFFSSTGKWLGRAVGVFVGGVIWITLFS